MTKKIELKDLSTKLWRANQKSEPVVEYDAELDTFFICFVPDGKGPVVTHYIDKYVAVMYQHADKEIVGFSIEGFIGDFAKHFSGEEPWSLMHTGTLFQGVREVRIGVQEIVLGAQQVEQPSDAPRPKQTKPLPVPVHRTPVNIRKESMMQPQYEQVFG